MRDLDPEEFDAFFAAIHGYPPFPWQARLLARLARGDGWPALLDLPTGVGKTAALDAAVFHLALDASRPMRTASRRVVFVVDRRTIVDQAYVRAKKIANAIAEATSGILVAVRERLAAYHDGDEALAVTVLRGGMPRSDAWAKTPDQPLIAVSTVDQVGSRLLFRGYGVSDGMRPIHAGLLGNDVLWLLDEVHLSEPFRETLAAIGQRYRGWAEVSVRAPFAVVEMSATPGATADGGARFTLEDADRRHERLARRLENRKAVALKRVKSNGAFADECAELAMQAVKAGQAAAVAVVVNRVRTAREVADKARAKVGDLADVVLVTGRMRPIDRDEVERRIVPRVGAGERKRGPGERPILVVATQCIEAGADFDFDFLVSECASLDALRQRFGRLDRLGELGASSGVIVLRSGDLGGDPVYGDALKATAAWLEAQPSLDFGPSHFPALDPSVLATLVAPKLHAPILLPAHLDAWVQTSPVPEPDPDVSLWLHGPQRPSAEVQLVWRADLNEAALDAAAEDALAALVAGMPPTPGEAMAVPIGAVKRWLLGLPEPPAADVEGAVAVDDDERAQPSRAWRALRWSARDKAVDVVEADLIAPGDTVLVPAMYGGVTSGNWDPTSADVVSDRAEATTLRQRGRVSLRLHPAVVGDGWPRPSDQTDDRDAVTTWIQGFAGDAEGELGQLVAKLAAEKAKRWRVVRVPLLTSAAPGSGEDGPRECFVVSGRKRFGPDQAGMTTEQEEGSFSGVEVTLREHLDGVATVAGGFARRVGLGAELVSDVILAAGWHDAGKVDRRFQRMLHGGDRFRAEVAEEPIAKSATAANDQRSRQRAQEASGYPRGSRHEVLSVAMMRGSEALAARAWDWELVLHLVASHHGHCRPLAPVVFDDAPVVAELERDGVRLTASSAHGLEQLDSGIGERFWVLVRRYGWWGLAWLEALVRLGDHRRSEDEQRSAKGGAS
ncbi:MAG: type I-U CRISPR-associated helicase/endonuclease Cas3 [Myxococcota bacterium]